ncbi:hypothetical protein J6590_035101 [Homalodisca vitripennis]|nr:hypothetical protein J6590_035101 [Homalodisca vitripennis]
MESDYHSRFSHKVSRVEGMAQIATDQREHTQLYNELLRLPWSLIITADSHTRMRQTRGNIHSCTMNYFDFHGVSRVEGMAQIATDQREHTQLYNELLRLPWSLMITVDSHTRLRQTRGNIHSCTMNYFDFHGVSRVEGIAQIATDQREHTQLYNELLRLPWSLMIIVDSHTRLRQTRGNIHSCTVTDFVFHGVSRVEGIAQIATDQREHTQLYNELLRLPWSLMIIVDSHTRFTHKASRVEGMAQIATDQREHTQLYSN